MFIKNQKNYNYASKNRLIGIEFNLNDLKIFFCNTKVALLFIDTPYSNTNNSFLNVKIQKHFLPNKLGIIKLQFT